MFSNVCSFLYCSGLNFQDLMVRLGAIDSPPKTPTILGFECAGEVEAIGEGVEDFKVSWRLRCACDNISIFIPVWFIFFISSWTQVGDRVVALPEFRAWAELCAVPTKYVYKLPDELSFQDAAAITMNYLVAYIIVFELLSLRPGKSLMLHSAGGGVVSSKTFLSIKFIAMNFMIHLSRTRQWFSPVQPLTFEALARQEHLRPELRYFYSPPSRTQFRPWLFKLLRSGMCFWTFLSQPPMQCASFNKLNIIWYVIRWK